MRRPGRTLCALAAILVTLAATGCSTLGYYVQAARGQWHMMRAARPIDDWLSDSRTPEDLRQRLQTVREIRAFASRDLALPDNSSYRTYADLGRPFAVWNVVAAPEFSTRPRQWCFPVAGCVSYKGWFDGTKAEDAASRLRAEGFDVLVYGVPAYSTLGWFADPVLNTYVRYPRAELARLVFHELAHQVAYLGGDSTFNESFATSVEMEGVRRWLGREGGAAERAEFEAMSRRRADFLALIAETRDELDHLYGLSLADSEKRRRKAQVLDRLQERYRDLKARWNGFSGYDRWFAQPLSNAHVASVSTYTDLVSAFDRLRERFEGDLPAFYAEVRRLAALGRAEREAALR